MPYLLRPLSKPRLEGLSPADQRVIQQHFDANSVEINIDGQFLEYGRIDSIEVAVAARTRNPAGWFVRNVVYGGEPRYHIGIYYGRHELVLTNLTRDAVQYVTGVIAFYARNRIKYSGPEDIIPIGD